MNFKWNFTEICSLGSNWQYGSIASDKSWQVPKRRQAIIWTKDGMFYWSTYASLGLNELMNSAFFMRNESKFGFILCQLVIILWKSFIS